MAKKNVDGKKDEEKKKKAPVVEKDEDEEDEDLDDEEDVEDEDVSDNEDEESEDEDEEDEDVEEEEVIVKKNKKITVKWREGERTYSLLVHGKNFKELADEFIKKHNAVIVKADK